jgi:hypothetical protein
MNFSIFATNKVSALSDVAILYILVILLLEYASYEPCPGEPPTFESMQQLVHSQLHHWPSGGKFLFLCDFILYPGCQLDLVRISYVLDIPHLFSHLNYTLTPLWNLFLHCMVISHKKSSSWVQDCVLRGNPKGKNHHGLRITFSKHLHFIPNLQHALNFMFCRTLKDSFLLITTRSMRDSGIEIPMSLVTGKLGFRRAKYLL